MKKKLEIIHDAGDGVTVVRTGLKSRSSRLEDGRSDDTPERCKHLRPARRKRVLGDPESLSGLLALFPSSAPSADVQKFLPRKPVVGVVGKTTSREVVAGPVFSLAEAFNSSAAFHELLKKPGPRGLTRQVRHRVGDIQTTEVVLIGYLCRPEEVGARLRKACRVDGRKGVVDRMVQTIEGLPENGYGKSDLSLLSNRFFGRAPGFAIPGQPRHVRGSEPVPVAYLMRELPKPPRQVAKVSPAL